MMNKKFLSILLSASLLASSASYLTYAAPMPVTYFDTAVDEISEADDISTTSAPEEASQIKTPSAALSFDTATEQNTIFGTPDMADTAVLSADTLEGLGTKESPYLITSADELILFSSNINSGINAGAYYRLTSSIDLGGAEWTPIGYLASSNDYSKTFHGEFDGAGFTVSNFKITKADTNYIGFFGYIYEGTVKNLNLDNVTINVSSSVSGQNIYFGTLVGRILTVNGNDGGKSEISNCNITNSTLTAQTLGTIYAGGLAGSAIAGTFTHENKSEIIISMCDVDCDIVASSASLNRVNLALGGLIGYLGCEEDALMNVMNCNTFGSVTSNSTSVSTITVLAGGVFGLVMTFNDTIIGGETNISSCHSEGDISVKSVSAVYAAGFAGQISASDITTIKDCYSASNISGYSGGIYTVLGGFMGMTDYYYFSSENGNNTIFNCYSTGDVIDTIYNSSQKGISYVGAFVGYTPVGIFNGCYKLESQFVTGSDISVDDIKYLNVTEERNKSSYENFDFENTWAMDPNADYFYPTLIEKIAYVVYMNESTVFANDVFGTDGIISIPSAVPSKASTVDLSFTFSHWSLTNGGAEFDFDESVYENTVLYAVYTSSPREYTISFIACDENFVPQTTLVYGSSVIVPDTIPTKEDEGRYYYEFSHWSLTKDGEDCNPAEFSVTGDLTFYAVFMQLDKNMWTGNVAASFASGYGTQEMPYIIERAEELAFMQKVINEKVSDYDGAYFALGDDINLGGKYWTPIGLSENIPFSGHFNGNGYRILNYKVSDNQYAGFFGYVKNGTIKNVHFSDFDIDITYNLDDPSLYVYTGGVAGYYDSIAFAGEISGIRVSANKFEVSGNAKHIYAGGIVGFGSAHNAGTTTIHDSFVTTPITVTAESGYAYAGGIAARYETNSASVSKIINCYNIGDISATSANSSYAGGLVGYLFSHGSIYTGGLSEDVALLSSDDKDIMIIGSFALANVSASSTGLSENVGYVAGKITDYADVDAVFYTGEKTLSGNDVQSAGLKMASKHFLDKDFLMEEIGFDFDNTWTYLSSGYEYPILKCMVSDKPGIKIISAKLEDGSLNITARINASDYTAIIGVYSARNQLIKIERISANGFIELELSYGGTGIDKAAYVKVSALSNNNYKPLFESVSHEI